MDVEMPDGTVIEDVPEGVTQRDLLRRYQKAKPQSTISDVAKSAAYAPAKAATGLAGFPADVLGMMSNLASKGMSKVSGIDAGYFKQPSLFDLLGSQSLRKGAESLTGEWYDPQTRAGKVADTGVQTALMMGRNWATTPMQAAKLTGAVTAGTEGAGALTNDNPWARLLGGLGAGMAPTLANAMKTRTGAVVRDALGDLSDADISAAIARSRMAQGQGVPLMGTEALDRGHQLASQVRASTSGNKILDPFLTRRPDQVRTAVERDIISKTGPRGTPTENAQRAQQAATDVISNAERARTAAVNPFYKAAEYETVPGAALRPVASEIESQIYQQPVGSAAEKALGKTYGQVFREETKTVAPAAGKGAPRVVGVDPNKDDIVTAVRKLGGINPDDQLVGRDLAKNMDFGPSFAGPVWRTPQFGGANRSNTKAGHSAEEITRKLYEAGYVNDPSDFNGVLSRLDDQLLGQKTHYSQFYEPPQTDPLAAAIDRLNATLAPRKQGAKGQTITTVEPETQVGRLNKLYQNLRYETDLPGIGATSEQKVGAYPLGKVRDALGDMLRRENPNLRRGMETYEQMTRNVVEPLTAGPIGVVAGKRGVIPGEPSPVARVTAAVADTTTARPDTIRQLYVNLNKQDRQAFPGIVQSHLENRLNAAMENLRSGPNPTAGAKFYQAVAGTPQDEANFVEMMRGVAIAHGKNPNEVVSGAKNLLRTLDLTGRTPGVGSQTQPRLAVERELSKTKIGTTMDAISASPLGPFRERLTDWTLRGRYEDLARVLTAPDSVEQLVKMAKMKPNGITAKYYAASLLGLDRAIAADQ